MGMVGGGHGAFIGAVHRMAAALDGEIELVCGAFSRRSDVSLETGIALGLEQNRIYPDFETMMESEAALPAEIRMQFVAIVTPNRLHFSVAKSALQHGFHVFSDKPATYDLNEAIELKQLVQDSGLLYGLAHTYTGYPLIKEARQRIAKGELGQIRKVLVEYPQGWLSEPEEHAGNKQAIWRLDPEQAGISCCIGDIGVHAANLAEYVSGQNITAVCADLTSVVPGRELDDDGDILLRFNGGAKGVLVASQICTGEENPLRIRVYGEFGGLEWAQHEPNTLVMKWPEKPSEMLRTGASYLSDLAKENTRTPGGHPEGYLEAFANLYLAFVGQIRATESGQEMSAKAQDCPGITEAVRGMAFIELAVKASNSDIKWHAFPVC